MSGDTLWNNLDASQSSHVCSSLVAFIVIHTDKCLHVTGEQVGYSVLIISVYVTILCKMWACGIAVM